MSVGDEIGLTEELYTQLIGKYVATIEILMKRLSAKDQAIAELESKLLTAESGGKKVPKKS